jgi:hypothetical protein
MKNPFPGMDPWMEGQWGDAHHTMIAFARTQIRPLLPPDLKARVEERVYIAPERPRRRSQGVTRGPDLSIVKRGIGSAVRPNVAAVVRAGTPSGAIATPVVLKLSGGDPVTEGYIAIREREPSNRLVTVIEVLSPSNKRTGVGRVKYRAKQRECLASGVNLVEIDLLRGGRWTVLAPFDQLPEGDEDAPYRASVWRAVTPGDVELYAFPLRDRLPAIAVPLRGSDPAVPLDLQPLVDGAYEEGEYNDTDYSLPPAPKLAAGDAAWAEALLRESGLLSR